MNSKKNSQLSLGRITLGFLGFTLGLWAQGSLSSLEARAQYGWGQQTPIQSPPVSVGDEDDAQAAELMTQSMAGLGCERAGEMLRRLSNQLLGSVQFATQPGNGYGSPPSWDQRGRMRERMRARWQRRLQSPRFWQKVWDRLAIAYRSCNRSCFDDGVAVGLISGAGYCSASVQVGGLNAPGFTAQPPLPVCETATFSGCQLGFRQGAQAFNGCQTYTSGAFETVFNEYQSQDCHIDP